MSTLCGGILLAAAAAMAGAPPAAADQSWKTSSAVWKQMDNCNKAALKAFPDYTREGNTKREAFRRNCLRGGNLPGETGPEPAPAPTGDTATQQ